ncbi:putative papain-like cysteine peptidase [Cotonvirus japonicus]|uniref:Papain-like cysteine peptidase n=1 Tax=Cotonvirus japonicus TaxID=2811091 RepID=A0ABM7NSR6_9VIRU|nr:putative papain-like cysteine peptidase [Cotonvirus japonicus]BCS83212.1 putative papain-like cysteine peptidase [Cotonvirus japonicus]
MTDHEFISLGSNCAVKFSISHFNEYQMAYPFDWLITNNIDKIVKFINDGNYDDFIDFDHYSFQIGHSNNLVTDLESKIINGLDKNTLINTVIKYNKEPIFLKERIYDELKTLVDESSKKINQTINLEEVTSELFKKLVIIMTCENTMLVHDHHINISWNDVKEKYHRRFERFLNINELNKPIIFVRFVHYDEDINKLRNALQKNFKNYYLLLLYNDDKLNKNDIQLFTKIDDICYKYTGNLIFDSQPFFKQIFQNFVTNVIKNNH